MDRATVAVYEGRAEVYRDRRPPAHIALAERFAADCLPGLPVADLGCGPGAYLAHLPRPRLGVDAAGAMTRLARQQDPSGWFLRADLESLPLAPRSLGGAWARHTYLHLGRTALPLALAQLHWAMVPGAPLMLSVTHGDGEGELPEDDIPGRFFCSWQAGPLHDVLTGAGFAVEAVEVEGRSLFSHSRRARSLPDTVGPGLRLLICGLNPSEVAADAGFGFAGATNRFWSAAMAAGVISRPRDPRHALVEHGVGMTDLVKRASPRASALTVAEYRWGLARVERLVSWLEPRAICFVGLDGWRKAVDAKAVAGWQTRPLGPTPVYVMPSTSGANAHASLAVLVSHLRAAASTPPKL